jgi:hypothetical protein
MSFLSLLAKRLQPVLLKQTKKATEVVKLQKRHKKKGASSSREIKRGRERHLTLHLNVRPTSKGCHSGEPPGAANTPRAQFAEPPIRPYSPNTPKDRVPPSTSAHSTHSPDCEACVASLTSFPLKRHALPCTGRLRN